MTKIIEYGENSILGGAVFEFTSHQLDSMAISWCDYAFCPGGSMWPDDFKQLWNLK